MKTELTNELIKLEFSTSYNQFYIHDKDADIGTDSDEFWSEEASRRRLAASAGVLGVGTECYGPVKGEIEFLNSKPKISNFDPYDHVVEGDLYLSSGILQITDCPHRAIEFEKQIPPGTYRVRIYSSNLISVEGDEGDDYYRIEVWSEKPSKVNIIKEYKG